MDEPESAESVSRRDVLRAGALAGGAIVGAASVQAAPAYRHYDDDVRSGTTLRYDQALLEAHRPRLLTGHLEFQPMWLQGLVAENPERDTTMLVYWARYETQEGWLLVDSHWGDHEPFYVELDETGVVAVHFSAYHWLRASVQDPPTQDGHPLAYVFKPHHHHRTATRVGQFYEVRDLTQQYPVWLEEGLADDIAPGAVTNPWIIKDRRSWWRDSASSVGVSKERWAELFGALGFDDAGETPAFQ